MDANRYYRGRPAEDEHFTKMEQYTVRDCTPAIPQGTCSACPLDIANVEFHPRGSRANKSGCNKGDFINCGRMFKIDSAECKSALYTWARDTECDAVLPSVLKTYYEDNPGNGYNEEKDRAGQVLDRYVYSVCEQCCDCIPCSEETNTLDPKIADEDLVDFIDVYRHNCPLHWVYDVCGVYPDIKYTRELPRSEAGRPGLLREGVVEVAVAEAAAEVREVVEETQRAVARAARKEVG